MEWPCILFDLDGTLVDSELLNNRALLELLPDLDGDAAELGRRYRGVKLAVILRDIETRLGRRLPDDFIQRYRAHVAELFTSELRPTPGTAEVLAALDLPRCVASSAPMPKIRHALAVTGLAAYFGDRLFSSYDVGSWKPEPGLFLHAAERMGFAPERCVVVEDSDVGLQAATAARMHAVYYAPVDGSVDAQPHAVIRSMSELPGALARL